MLQAVSGLHDREHKIAALVAWHVYLSVKGMEDMLGGLQSVCMADAHILLESSQGCVCLRLLMWVHFRNGV